MAVLNVVSNETGLVGVTPSLLYISTNNPIAETLAFGFLTACQTIYGAIFSDQQAALVTTTDRGTVLLQVTINGTQISLESPTVGGQLTWGGGASSHAFTIPGLTSDSIISVQLVATTNLVSIIKAAPSLNTLTVTFSGDPGADTIVAYLQ